jgi:2,4-dienoyl-CoA reductase-like NADH-dependent reductase (Old Yellow Enzyme family)
MQLSASVLPVTLGDTIFRNRIFASPTGVFYADPAHPPINETICYYERKAKGGAASVCVGDAMVDTEHGAHGNYCMVMEDPGLMPALNKLSSQISRHGAVPSLEMFHAGSAALYSYLAGHEIYGPQDERVAGALGHDPVQVKALDRAVMDRIVRLHVDGAMKAKSCGFGMVTLHAAHGFLMHQFCRRRSTAEPTNMAGRSQNRMRFPLEIVRAVRAAVGPKFPLELRISGSEVYDGGYGIDYGVQIAEVFDGLPDLIHVSAGSHEDARVFTVTHPSMFLEDGVNVKYAAEIKKHVRKSKVATVGALSDPAMLEEIIAPGKADIVELARGLICDPDLPKQGPGRQGRGDRHVHPLLHLLFQPDRPRPDCLRLKPGDRRRVRTEIHARPGKAKKGPDRRRRDRRHGGGRHLRPARARGHPLRKVGPARRRAPLRERRPV